MSRNSLLEADAKSEGEVFVYELSGCGFESNVSFNSSIIFCLSLGEIYLSFGIPLITSSCDFFEGFTVILSAILLAIKSPVAFAISLSIFLPAV